jgi:hypothetical protein
MRQRPVRVWETDDPTRDGRTTRPGLAESGETPASTAPSAKNSQECRTAKAGTIRADSTRMSYPRRVVPGMTVMVTRRTLRRTHLLHPDPQLNNLFIYCLAVLATRYDILVHAVVVMSTHHEARGIVGSVEFTQLRSAFETGQSVSVQIAGRLIQYEPGLPASGMTMFGENGFLLGREAFSSEAELGKTILHELYRLATSGSASGVSATMATSETQAAFGFAERAIGELF